MRPSSSRTDPISDRSEGWVGRPARLNLVFFMRFAKSETPNTELTFYKESSHCLKTYSRSHPLSLAAISVHETGCDSNGGMNEVGCS